jgi:hypothetical protein
MEIVNVESSNINYIAYHDEYKRLYVEFKQCKVYKYDNVPKSVYYGLLNSDSKGSYLHQHIKNKYNYEALNTDEPKLLSKTEMFEIHGIQIDEEKHIRIKSLKYPTNIIILPYDDNLFDLYEKLGDIVQRM